MLPHVHAQQRHEVRVHGVLVGQGLNQDVAIILVQHCVAAANSEEISAHGLMQELVCCKHILSTKPCPSGALHRSRLGGEGGLKVLRSHQPKSIVTVSTNSKEGRCLARCYLEGAKGALESVQQVTRRVLILLGRAKIGPEDGVVEMATTVELDGLL